MSLLVAASQAGILTRAVQIMDEFTALPTQQIRSGAGQIRQMCGRRRR